MKLSLSKETIATLSIATLNDAMGGATMPNTCRTYTVQEGMYGCNITNECTNSVNSMYRDTGCLACNCIN